MFRSSTPTSTGRMCHLEPGLAPGPLRHPADLPGLALRQRLQPLRPHLAGDRPGRRSVPERSPRTSAASRCATSSGAMVPLGSLADVREINGPLILMRYNMYPAAPINGAAPPGVSSGDAIKQMDELADKTLPASMSHEWTDMAYLELQAGRHGDDRVRPRRGTRVPGPRRPVRELVAAAGGHPGRAHVPPERPGRRDGSRARTSISSRRSASWCWSAWRARTPS